MKRFYITDIKYDTDGKRISLPTEMEIICEDEDRIADTISDETGFLVESFIIDQEHIDLLNKARAVAFDQKMIDAVNDARTQLKNIGSDAYRLVNLRINTKEKLERIVDEFFDVPTPLYIKNALLKK